MLYVLDKSKIYSYMIAVCTVVVLFAAASTINDALSPSQESIVTGTNVIESNEIKNYIVNE